MEHVEQMGARCKLCGGQLKVSVEHATHKEYVCEYCKVRFKGEVVTSFADYRDELNKYLGFIDGTVEPNFDALEKDLEDLRARFPYYTSNDPQYFLAEAVVSTKNFKDRYRATKKLCKNANRLYKTSEQLLEKSEETALDGKGMLLKERYLEWRESAKMPKWAKIAMISVATCFVVGTPLLAHFGERTIACDETGVSVYLESGDYNLFDKWFVKLDANELTEDAVEYEATTKLLKNESEKFKVYDINVLSGANKIQPDDKVQVTIPVPEDYYFRNVVVYYIADDGSCHLIESENVEATHSVTFEVEHFSLYAIAERPYIVTFETNCDDTVSTEQVLWGDLIEEPAPIQKTGYTFMGWYDGETRWNFSTGIVGRDVHLTAKWQINTYKISYDPNGGSVENDEQFVTYATNFTLETPTRTGYEFLGWLDENDAPFVAGKWTGLSDVALTASWRAYDYKISYKANGGTGEMSDSAYQYDEEKPLAKNSFERTGYTFLGWSKTQTATTAEYADEKTVKNLTTADEDTITLYAIWRAHTYTIKYEANGGTGEILDTSLFYDESKILPKNVFERTGYTFLGWSQTQTATTAEYTDEQQIKNLTTVDEDTITLYAIWRAHTYKVAYNANGGTGSKSSQTHTYGVSKTLYMNNGTFTRTGYTFAGWSRNATAQTAEFGQAESVKNLTAEDGATVTLYVVWKANTYTISYKANGGTGTTGESLHTYDVEKQLTKNSFARTGYTFMGWSRTHNSVFATYTDEQKVMNLSSGNGDTLTLYAIWSANKYTLHYDPNGGTCQTEQTVIYDQACVLEMPIRTGYTFLGWFDKENQPFINGTWKTTSNVYLKAEWTKNTYTIRYDANSGDGSMNATSHTYDESKLLSENKFVKTGYTFMGWTTSPNSQTVVYTDKQEIKNLTSENNATVTLYAVWSANTYTVYYNGNGGEVIPSQAVTYDQDYVLETPIKTGYHAVWRDEQGNVFTSGNWKLTTNVRLTAEWTANAYKITYNADGGVGEMSSTTATYDKETTLAENVFTKGGYTFKGWNVAPSLQTVEYADKAKVKNLTSEQDGEFILYAVWIPIEYTVSYDANGGDGEMASTTTPFKEEFTLQKTPFTKTGYTFMGWSTTRNGEKVFEDGGIAVIDTPDPSNSATLYAVWKPNEYTLNYNLNTSSILKTPTCAKTEFTVTFMTTATLDVPTADYYAFNGWSVGDVQITDGTGKILPNVPNYTDANGNWIYADNVTLTAKWSQTYADYTYINTRAGLAGMATSGKYMLIENIDLSASAWTAIGSFSGILDGDNHTINGLKSSKALANGELYGLIKTLTGTVKNIAFTNVAIATTGADDRENLRVGTVCGYANGATIENVTVSGSVKMTGVKDGYTHVGGICGMAQSAKITDCTNNASVYASKGSANAGGIAGRAKASVFTRCTNTGAVQAKYTVFAGNARSAGICPYAESSEFYSCKNSGTISSTTSSWGGSTPEYNIANS
ncbi:MAG: InlB B-repeat-containing protein [Clostridia bacterium]|nr:InlB B-repeat-containing protein [Clostridia bacterium]